jgi:hypothetical protein
MKSIIKVKVEVGGRNGSCCIANKYMEIDRRITTVYFLSIPIYRKEESFSD